MIELDRALLDRHPLPTLDEGDKDAHGTLLVIAGSRDVPGAPLLTAEAALRAGAGKMQLAAPDDIAVPLGIGLPEAMIVGFATDPDGGFARSAVAALLDRAREADAIVAGSAMRGNPASNALAGALLRLAKPLVLDAALLHELPGHDEESREAAVKPILLPHAGEMASLLQCEAAEVERDPVGCGVTCARRYDALVLVKGAQSHVVTPGEEVFHYRGGGPGLGVSGSGDVLAGIVGGLLARGAKPLAALLWGVWLHGEAGRSLARSVGPIGFLARELPGAIPALLPR